MSYSSASITNSGCGTPADGAAPSRAEALGCRKAQACSAPVFAFAVGGVPETLIDGKTGVLVPFGECEEMAAQIVAAYRKGRLESMGQAGAEWVRGQFDSLVVAKKYVEVYEELLAGTARG